MSQITELGPISPLQEESAMPRHPVIVRGEALLQEVIGDNAPVNLDQWRVVIDELDFVVMAVAAARVQATEAVSILKAKDGQPSIDLRRESEITQTAIEMGKALGLDSRPIRGFFLALIGVAHEQHKRARQIKPIE